MGNPVVLVVAAVIERDGKYLITQRRDEAVLPRLWEFPGGRVHEGEEPEAALRREVKERIAADVEVDRQLAETHHEYEGYEVHLRLYACRLEPGVEPQPVRVKDARWVTSTEFTSYEFPPADQATMDKLLGLGAAAN